MGFRHNHKGGTIETTIKSESYKVVSVERQLYLGSIYDKWVEWNEQSQNTKYVWLFDIPVFNFSLGKYWLKEHEDENMILNISDVRAKLFKLMNFCCSTLLSFVTCNTIKVVFLIQYDTFDAVYNFIPVWSFTLGHYLTILIHFIE